jgi:trk system potassium uptake protein TrkH
MRLRIVFHYVGIVITAVGLFMFIPLICSLIYREGDWSALLLSAAITTGFGGLLLLFTPREEKQLLLRETLAIVTFSWVLMAAFGALPYVFAGIFSNYIDAFFESMSGFTTTGSSVMVDIEIIPHGILFWRSFSQWLGGMGIITLFVALFPGMSIGASRLIKAETSTTWEHKLTARIKDTARILWLVYCGITVLESISLLIAGVPVFDAITISFSSVSTGGFAVTNLSIGTYNSVAVEIIVIIFMILGATNFGLLSTLFWKGNPYLLLKNTEFRFSIALLATATIMIILNLVTVNGFSISEAVRYGMFNTVSVMTTTGFANADFNLWPDFSRVILLILMIIGASAGSTGGGIKAIRFIVLIKYIYRNILHSINPQLVMPMKIGGEVIPESVYSPFISMSILYIIVLAAACLILTLLGTDMMTAFSAAATTMGTTGPGLGMVGPMANFFFFSSFAKIILIVCMLLGRLELFTVLAIFTPSYWKWR